MTATQPQLPQVQDISLVPDPTLTRRHHVVPPDLLSAITATAIAEGLSLRAVLTAVFARCLADWCKEPRFTVDVAGDGPVDVDVTAGQSLVELAKDIETELAPGADHPLVLDTGGTLFHEVAMGDGNLVLTWDTVDAVYPAGLPDDMATAHLRTLHRLAEDPDLWHGPMPECLPEAQALVRKRVNATAAPLEPVLLHELFWRQASGTPEAIAVIDHQRTVTYRQLRAGAAALADSLMRHGAGPGRLVAVVMHKGWEQALAVLGILACGAAYVPIAPDLPEERLLHLLRHAEVSVLVTQPQLAGQLPRTPGVWRVVVDDDLLTAEDQPLMRRQQPTDLAYVIYTSGSTGLPKGVMIDHRGAVNTILDINRRFNVGPTDRVLALSSLGFDLSVYDIFGILAAGGAVVFPQSGTERAPWEWAEMIAAHRVSIWNTVPALMEMLVTYAEGRSMRIADSLRLVLMSGDWIPVPLPDRIRLLARSDTVLIGMGGATEASIWSNFYPIGAVDPAWPSIPYGKPLANQSFEVLDSGLRRRPDWVPGELYIGGLGVAMGYWLDEEKTKRSFIVHPETGQRLYRTGDLGRYLPDGNLEFLGREDFQVKVHGFRVELGEIEATLLAHGTVTGAVVNAVEAGQGSKRLVAYVTPANAPIEVVREHLAAKLPSYMVPDRIVALEAFPLTTNGKVDRRSLPR